MICNPQIHDELKQMEESVCPFCDQLLLEWDKSTDFCCAEPNVDNNDGMNLCLNCSSVYGYDYIDEFVKFHDNIYRIHRKSVYQRKYHIENILNGLLVNQRVELTHYQRDRIYKVFVEIGNILGEVNGSRKRMISTKFIIRKIFEMMGIPYEQIPITKSKKTIVFYDKYWTQIMALIGDKIKTIIG